MKNNIVALGGGTGLAQLLTGIKKYTDKITAVVTVTDDGGSSGELRKEFGILPPGDIRNCLVALADEEKLMSNLFQYRFRGDGRLGGHSFGNIFITAMTHLCGSIVEGIEQASKVLAIKGKVLPVTLENLELAAKLFNGKIIYGESNITKQGKNIKRIFFNPQRQPKPAPYVINSLKKADAIVLGPGSLFTSLIPNLLVKGVKHILKKLKIPKIYIANLMTEPQETSNFKLSDYVKAIENHIGFFPFNYLLVNNGKISKKMLKKYSKEESFPVEVDLEKLKKYNIKIILNDFVEEKDYIRHNPEKLAKAILKIVWSESS